MSDDSSLIREDNVERDGRLSKQFRNNLFTAYFLMFCNILKNFMQCTYTKRFVAGNGQVMGFAGNNSRQALVATRLMVNTISIPVKKTGKFVAIDISGKFHAAISSSFTWCSLIK